MECTQRIECTQDMSYIAASQRICPQQIGFLGISGVKYPLNKGPNKIGRDPKTCNIVLDENTISRQHAVINIMNDKNFVLMDLESSNRTKLLGTTIQPYTPHALNNGDTVQFGDVFGIFRLLEEVDDLPLTQAVDIPATPVNTRHVSRANAQIKTVPETPDVSDRDDSLIGPSPRRSNNNNLTRSPGPIIGSNKIDNMYWKSSKKSDSFNQHFEGNLSKVQVNEIFVSPKQVSAAHNNIFDLETQPPNVVEDNPTDVSIYEAQTQPNVSNKVTLPKVFKVQDQNNIQLNLYARNKKDINIHEADTQITLHGNEESTSKATTTEPEKPLDDEDLTDFEDEMIELNTKKTEPDIVSKIDDDDTDCEDEIIEISQNRSKVNDTFHNAEVVGNFEDLPTQVIGEIEVDKDARKSDNVGVPFEDILTQVIEVCPGEDNVDQTRKEIDSPLLFEDLQTQVIEKVISTEPKKAGPKTLFKVPSSPLRLKRKEISPTKTVSNPTPIITKETNGENKDEDDENYYVNTQQVFEDLCSQSIINGYDLEMDTNKLSIDTLGRENSSGASDGIENFQCIVSNMSKEQVRDIIGVDVAPLSKKKSSDSSDLEMTPKKFNPSKFLTIDLPNSQDIKSCKFVSSKVNEADLSDGFEGTEEQDDMSTSDICRGKKRRTVKQDLSKKFNVNTLPTRAITRIRKCTSKMLDSDDTSRKKSEKILESKLGLDNKIEIDSEVIQFNLARLRNKAEKEKNKNRKNSTEDPSKRESLVNEKVLKQQNIASMLKTEPKRIKLLDAAEVNTKTNDSSNKKQRSSRSKNKTEETVSKVEEANPKKRGRKKATSRENIKETINLTLDEPLIPRRSKRNQAPSKIEDKVEKTRKARNKRDSNKSDEESSSYSNSNDTKSSNNKHSASLNIKSEKAESTSKSGRQSSSTNSSNNNTSTEKSRNTKQKNERTKTDKSASTSRSTNRSTNREDSTNPFNATASGSDLKRQSSSDLMHPSKRTKVSEEPSRTKSSRGIKVHYVVFTAFMSDPVVEKLQNLGAVIVTEVKSCTVLLTKELKRTCKLLCAVGLGKPIVGLDWVQACSDAQMIVDPWLYLMKDEAMERRQKFNLQQSITCGRNFLKGYKVSCTPHAKPSADELKEIVECSGGTFGEGGNQWLCLSCPADELLWPALRRRGARMIDTDTFLAIIMRQKLDFGGRSSSSSKPRTYQRNTGFSN